ncbi:uncharacterized protein LOC114755372 [Neltuma alba]|uniref:uncharacterized protein LOC114755372 n=1 Tax=Neltuma alba TaxID=207710 RepID=UPI0010A41790|nr:uncharacterized protein LOC114755372 [Prosopis alba]
MEKKALLGLVVILLALSHVASVPASRSLVAKQADPSPVLQDHHVKEATDLKTSTEEAFEMEKDAGEGRMMMDVVDYSGPKPNPAHNPRSPGKPGF